MSQNWKNKDKKRNKYYDFHSQKRKKFGTVLTEGVKGFMLTCNAKEAECVREAYNILNEYYEKLYEKEQEATVSGDIGKQLEDEINEMKIKPKRFKQMATNCRNVVFVESPEEVDPLAITEQLIKDIRTEKLQKTRHLLRFIPVVHTCKCNVESIEAAMRDLLATRNEQFVEYMVVCKVRNNDDASSLHLIEVIANIVRQEKPQWKVKFDNPTLTINADVICKVCCLSFLNDFMLNKKYNLVELSQSVINESENVDKKIKEETNELNENFQTKVETEESHSDTNSSTNVATKIKSEDEAVSEPGNGESSVNIKNEAKKMKIHVEINENADVKN